MAHITEGPRQAALKGTDAFHRAVLLEATADVTADWSVISSSFASERSFTGRGENRTVVRADMQWSHTLSEEQK